MSTVPVRIAASLSMVAISVTSSAQENRLEAAGPSIQFQAESDGSPFQSFSDGSRRVQEQAERFRDPQQRALIQAEQRKQLLDSHQYAPEILELDAATTDKLIDLLADYQTRNLEQF